MEKEDGITLRFVLDNDIHGFRKSRKLIDSGEQVFLWNKLYLDLLNSYKGKTPKQKIIKVLKNTKDFNELSLKYKKPIHKMFNLDNYFSKDELDIYYLMDLEELYKTNI